MNATISSFVDNLLAADPKPLHSLQLEIDTEGDVAAMFEVLLLIMTDILKRWYTPPISIGNITPEDGAKLVGYFASFGIKFTLDIQDTPRVLRINNRDYVNKSRLDEMMFKVEHAGKVYTVNFDILPTA